MDTALWFVTAGVVLFRFDKVSKDRRFVRRTALATFEVSALMLPVIYALGLFAAYELAFVRIDLKSKASRWARLRQKAALLTSFHVRATEVGAFTGPWQFRSRRRARSEPLAR